MAASEHARGGVKPRSTKRRLTAALVATLAVAGLAVGLGQSATAAGPGSPNIIFILTDDQTVQELAAMPQTNALLTSQGINFTRNYISYPLCCPSRATFLTGRYMHNHGVRGNAAPYGGAKHFQDLGGEQTALPTRLQTAGYFNVHIGKYLNGYGGGSACGDDSVPHVPPGWNEWYAKLGATNGACSENNYYQYSLFERGTADVLPHPPPGQVVDYGSSDADYQTDVYKNLALNVLNQRLPGSTPLYMTLAFGAPHGPFEPAPRHKFTLENTVLPPLPGFDEKNVSDKPSFIRDVARRRLTSIEKFNIAERRKRRLEQLQSVDEAVGEIVNKVAAMGELNNTYFIFSSDNGFFFGEHRIGSGKYLPYEPSARVPLVIRGPGIPAGSSSSELTANVDYLPTVLQIAGASAAPSAPVDGRSLLPFAHNPALRSQRPILLEGDTGPGIGPGQTTLDELKQRRKPQSKASQLGLTNLRGVNNLDMEPGFTRYAINGNLNVPAYKSIRTNRYEYTIYATGESELYDMLIDPAQLKNQAKNPRYRKVGKVLYRRLLNLSFCYAASCSANAGKDPKPVPKKHKRKK